MREIVVISGKGGTGKTSISASFSTIEKNTIVADCDVDAANLYLILQPQNYKEEVYVSGYSAVVDAELCANCGKCVSSCRFDAISEINGQVIISESACEGCKLCSRVCPTGAISMKASDKSRWYEGVYRHGSLVYARLAPGEENSGKLVSLVREQARKVAEKLQVDTIIIDGPPGTGCPVISTLTGATKALVVTEPSNSAFHDLKRVVELAAGFKVEIFVAINKYDLNTEVTAKIEAWCESENIEVIGKIPFDKQIVDAMVYCKSIVEFAPENESSKEIVKVYKHLVQ